MIEFNYRTEEGLKEEKKYTEWLVSVITSEHFLVGNICYVFTTDDDLLSINEKYLQHDFYTDIITFDYSEDIELSADIFISWDRVKENAIKFIVPFEEELRRVMVHGVLHLMGHKDNTSVEKRLMRKLEDEKIKMFHVEQ